MRACPCLWLSVVCGRYGFDEVRNATHIWIRFVFVFFVSRSAVEYIVMSVFLFPVFLQEPTVDTMILRSAVGKLLCSYFRGLYELHFFTFALFFSFCFFFFSFVPCVAVCLYLHAYTFMYIYILMPVVYFIDPPSLEETNLFLFYFCFSLFFYYLFLLFIFLVSFSFSFFC